jgi:hypothetical protein
MIAAPTWHCSDTVSLPSTISGQDPPTSRGAQRIARSAPSSPAPLARRGAALGLDCAARPSSTGIHAAMNMSDAWASELKKRKAALWPPRRLSFLLLLRCPTSGPSPYMCPHARLSPHTPDTSAAARESITGLVYDYFGPAEVDSWATDSDYGNRQRCSRAHLDRR